MYELAAKIASLAESGKGYKNVLYRNKNTGIIKSAYFLANNALRKKSFIDDLLKSVGLWDEVKDVIWLARVAVIQLLSGKSPLPKNIPIFRKLAQHKTKFKKLSSTNEQCVNTKDSQKIPRYIRINTEVYSKRSAIDFLNQKGFSQVQCSPTYPAYIEQLKNLKLKEYVFDFHVPNLIVFSDKADIKNLSQVDFVRQDKSSCLVNLLLAPVPGSEILDMCSAPGYKTQHASSIIDKKGKIYSVEINQDRYKVLQDTLERFGIEDICCPLNMDALKVTNTTCPDIEYIILDPPCSGTGMVNVLVRHTADEIRLKKLGNLQAMLLKHALSEFPCVRRVVYSTCSVTEEENEKVVSECLSVAKENGFKLVPLSSAFGGAFCAGVGDYPCSPSVLRVSPDTDLTNGFFVALFERSVPPKAPSWGHTESNSVSGSEICSDEESMPNDIEVKDILGVNNCDIEKNVLTKKLTPLSHNSPDTLKQKIKSKIKSRRIKNKKLTKQVKHLSKKKLLLKKSTKSNAWSIK